MIDLSQCRIKSVIVHNVGNKCKGEEIALSSKNVSLEDKYLEQYLMRYFYSHFNFEVFYSFVHQADKDLNEIFVYCKKIFKQKEDFLNQSINIAKHLYEVSTHPNIKKGELYVAYFEGCFLEGTMLDAVGIFKSENKDIFLNTNSVEGGYSISYHKGINIDKLDKGCIIFNTQEDKGYKIAVVDGNSTESKYWKDRFLNIEEINNEYRQTKQILSACKEFVINDRCLSANEKVQIINNSVEYFDTKESFNLKDFSETIIENDKREQFEVYIKEKATSVSENEFRDIAISMDAVKSVRKTIKNSIRLDDTVEIKISQQLKELEKIVTRGYDEEKEMNYYKIYFYDEK